jgi:hypothetical protein
MQVQLALFGSRLRQVSFSWAATWVELAVICFTFLLKIPVDRESFKEHNAGQNREFPLVKCRFEALAVCSRPILGQHQNKQ